MSQFVCIVIDISDSPANIIKELFHYQLTIWTIAWKVVSN